MDRPKHLPPVHRIESVRHVYLEDNIAPVPGVGPGPPTENVSDSLTASLGPDTELAGAKSLTDAGHGTGEEDLSHQPTKDLTNSDGVGAAALS